MKKIIILAVAAAALLPRLCLGLAFDGETPAEARVAKAFFIEVAKGRGLDAVETCFDPDGFAKRLAGDEYDTYTDGEKAYFRQLVTVFAKSTYRQDWFMYGIQDARFEAFSVEPEGAFLHVRTKRTAGNETIGVDLLLSGAGENAKIVDIGQDGKMVSDEMRKGMDRLAAESAGEMKEALKNYSRLDLFEAVLFSSSENWIALNYYLGKARGGETPSGGAQ